MVPQPQLLQQVLCLLLPTIKLSAGVSSGRQGPHLPPLPPKTTIWGGDSGVEARAEWESSLIRVGEEH